MYPYEKGSRLAPGEKAVASIQLGSFSTRPIESTEIFLKGMNHVINVLGHTGTFNKERKMREKETLAQEYSQ